MSKDLDTGTVFEILSIEIADIGIGDYIGPKLQTDQSEADLKVAHAKAGERRAFAIAHEQKMRAKAQDTSAKLIEAKSQTLLALPTLLNWQFRDHG